MDFLSPLWLMGLLPWLAVVLWLLTGKHEKTEVPFLELWRGAEKPLPKAKNAIQRPPLAIVLALAAMLLAILAAARPKLSFLNSTSPPKGILIDDRGYSMSASLKDDTGDKASDAYLHRYPGGTLERRIVPATEPTAIDSRPFVIAAIQRALAEPDSIVLVATDQTIDLSNSRVIQFTPETPRESIGFVQAAIAERPKPQIMVRIRNDSRAMQCELRIGAFAKTLDLPPIGQVRDYFIDRESLTSPLTLQLVATDGVRAHSITLTRSPANTQVRMEMNASPAMQRVVEVYQLIRQPQPNQPGIVLRDSASVSPNVAAVILAPTAPPVGNVSIRTESHPITSVVDWYRVATEGIGIAPPPLGDWRTIAWAGDKPILAIRESPARQVWVGFGSDTFPREADFVIFWSNVFDWAGGGTDRFIASGTFASPVLTPPKVDWQTRLNALPPSLQPGRDITSFVSIVSLLMIFGAALVPGVAKTAR